MPESDTPHINALPQSTLYVVATPIGNLEDITFRAVEVLRTVDLILAEDTRTFHRLAERYSIITPTDSYFEHNEKQKLPQVLARLESGARIALVSEAGTPTISDPGYRLVRAARLQGISVLTVPGPCAALAALSVSGIETDSFLFAGFLPQKPGRRKQALQRAAEGDVTTIFYESPYRIKKALQELADSAPDQRVFVARELTKLYEETFSGTAAAAVQWLEEKKAIKGEFVLIVARAV